MGDENSARTSHHSPREARVNQSGARGRRAGPCTHLITSVFELVALRLVPLHLAHVPTTDN